MRKVLLLTVLFLFLLVPASITWAQNITLHKGLITAIFNVPQGDIKIYLPADMKPGDVISGRIIVEPIGKTVKQTEKNLADLQKLSISLCDEKISVKEINKPFQFIVHSDRQLSSPIELLQVNGSKLQQLIIPASQTSGQSTSPIECKIPAHALTGSPLNIPGSFDGNSINTTCTLNSGQIEILAESPRQIIVMYPADAGGMGTMEIKEKDKSSCSQNVSGVNMDVSAGKINLQKGETTYIDIRITGLKNLPDTAVLTLINTTSGVVTMSPADEVIIPLSPKSVSSGNFEKRFDIKSLRKGSFIVRVNLDLPGYYDEVETTPPIQFDQKELDKPRKLEDKALQIGLHQAIKKLIADAGGARGQEWNTVCDNCRQCIEARMGEWAADLVKELGVGIIKEYLGKAIDLIGKAVKVVGAAKEFFDKISGKTENAEQLAKDIEDKIKAGELKVLELKPQFCVKSPYCLISGIIFYNPKTGCVFAIIYCQGSKMCCPEAETIITLTYCTDEKGMPTKVPDIGVIKN